MSTIRMTKKEIIVLLEVTGMLDREVVGRYLNSGSRELCQADLK
jgi:hypothetical protein